MSTTARRKTLGGLVAAFFAYAPLAACAQGAIQQAGPLTGGHALVALQNGIVQDGGFASGAPSPGLGISELLLTARGTGTAPFAGQGSGPLGTNFCNYDAPITNGTGYHYLCMSPNAQGGGLITYGAAGGASALPLTLNLNGSNYQFPFTVGGVTGPGTTVVGDIMTWNNTTGTLAADSGILATALAPKASPTFTGTVTLPDGSTWTSSALTLGGPVTATGRTITGGTYSGATLSGTTALPGSGAISSGGLLGLGMSPTNILDITQGQNAASLISILNGNAGAAASAGYTANNGTSVFQLLQTGANFTPSGMTRADGTKLSAAGAGGLTFLTTVSQPLYFGTNSTESYRIDTSQRMLVGYTADHGGGQLFQVAGAAFTSGALTTTALSGSNGFSQFGGTSAAGATVQGQGSVNDASLLNKNGTIAASVPTNTTNFSVVGNLAIGGNVSIAGTGIGVKQCNDSSPQTITAAGALSLAHGLSGQPSLITARLHNVTGELGYSPGDEVMTSLGPISDINAGAAVIPNAANLTIRFGSLAQTFVVLNATTGVAVGITNADWTIIFTACKVTTSADIVNRAVQLVGGFNNQNGVTGTPPLFDGSPFGIAAGTLYNGVVQTIGRQHGWDFSRNTVVSVLTGNPAPFPWAFEYAYPANGVQVRQVTPRALADPNNPLPTNWSVANDTGTKVILTNQANALAIFSNQPSEDLWDPLFTEAVVRLLASELAMAIEARPDTSRDALQSSQGFEQIGAVRDN